MLNLFTSLVMSRLDDDGFQLWSPHLVKHINLIEKVQKYFSIHIAGSRTYNIVTNFTI